MKLGIDLGVEMINDIYALRQPGSIEAVANSNSYQAFAYSNRNNDFYSITNNNVKASQVDGVRTDTEGW